MTHEELLAKFTDYEAHFDQVRDEPKVFAMLLAVVELHKPHDITWTGEAIPETFCEGCNEEYYVKYPCPTIQAIEKALS